jgi:hypothetical protein
LFDFYDKGGETMEKTHVYILLTDTGTLFTRTIKQYTKAPYNHSSLSFDKELSEMYSFGRKNPRNPFIGGFVKEDVVNGIYRFFPKTTCALFELEVDEKTLKKLKRIVNLFHKQKEKYSYNLMGVIGVAIQESYEPKGSFFCSQFVAEVLTRSGIRLWEKPSSLVTPEDFRNCPRLTLIYEGKLVEYEPIAMKFKRGLSEKM